MRIPTSLIACWLLVVPGLAFAGLTVNPIRIEKSLDGSDNQLEFIVSNSSEKDLHMTFSAGPLAHDENGAPVAGEPGSAYDISSRIRFERDTVLLPSRRWKRIRARVEVPSRPGGGYAFIYVHAVESAPAEEAKVVTATRVGIIVALTFSDPGTVSARVEHLSFVGGEPRVRLRNDGQRTTRPSGVLVLRDVSGKSIWSGELESANIFPELVRDLKVSGFPRELPSGQYSAEIQVTAPRALAETRRLAVMDGQIIPERPVVQRQH